MSAELFCRSDTKGIFLLSDDLTGYNRPYNIQKENAINVVRRKQ